MTRKNALFLFIILTVLLGREPREVARAAEPADDIPRQKAPDLTGASGWINTQRPISIGQLKGQVVLLDFWTYACINCIHVFPDLKYLEEKYRDRPLVIIGVHSGKFDEEKDADNIRAAVLRNKINHPVAVDNDYAVWNAYGVNAWPTLVLIDSEGNIADAVSGEGHREQLDHAIAALLALGEKTKTIGRPLRFQPEQDESSQRELSFPSKILADGAGKRLFISDSGHNRILITSLDGKVIDSIGGKESGFKDGSFAEAEFDAPNGLATSADQNTLYVADTQNHAVRAADLRLRKVQTLAGTGRQSHDFRASGPAKTTSLNSPWDLARVGDQLYIAMAGAHQIWALNLKSREVGVFAGDGHEGDVDGSFAESSFAQPSGLATDGKTLYVASSEASSIQAIDLMQGSVRTLAGSGQLFGFGAASGIGQAARFQHPLGVAIGADGQTLFIADTFNNLIRQLDVQTREVRDFAGTGKSDPGENGALGFFEPSGLSVLGGELYVADTNHHRIIKVDITKSGHAQALPIQTK